jgi:hypothetical protein
MQPKETQYKQSVLCPFNSFSIVVGRMSDRRRSSELLNQTHVVVGVLKKQRDPTFTVLISQG